MLLSNQLDTCSRESKHFVLGEGPGWAGRSWQAFDGFRKKEDREWDGLDGSITRVIMQLTSDAALGSVNNSVVLPTYLLPFCTDNEETAT